MVLSPGTLLGAAEVGVLAAVGATVVTVSSLPRVAVLSTGGRGASRLPLALLSLEMLTKRKKLNLVIPWWKKIQDSCYFSQIQKRAFFCFIPVNSHVSILN